MELLRKEYAQLQAKHAELQRRYDILRAEAPQRSSSGTLGTHSSGESPSGFVERLIDLIVDLFGSELYSDLTVRADGRDFPAHRLVVAAQTDYWGNLAGCARIELDDVGIAVANLLLRWMYTDLLDDTIGDSLMLDLLSAAIKYRLCELTERCETVLIGRVEMENCLKIYQFADENQLERLRDCCAELVAAKWADFRPEHFSDMRPALLYKMLRRKSKHLLNSILGLQREDVLEIFLTENRAELPSLLNSPDNDNNYPLGLLLGSKQFEIAKHLIDCGANVNQLDSKKHSFAWKAIENGNESASEFLLENGARLDEVDDSSGDTLLHMMANTLGGNFMKVLDTMIQRVDVNARNKLGRTALMSAVEKGNQEVLDKLLDNATTEVNLADLEGTTAIELALIIKKNLGFAEKLVQKGGVDLDRACAGGQTLWHKAVEAGDFAAAQFLSAHNADVNMIDARGSTPLHLLLNAIPAHGLPCADSRLLDTVKLVLKSGADPSITEESSGATALHLAVQRSKVVLDAVLDHCKGGPPLNVLDNEGRSPLWCALLSGWIDAAKRLIEAGADVNESGAREQAPPLLIRAIEMKRDDLARFLLDAGANPNIDSSRDGPSSLRLAVESGLTATVNYLCKLGASPNTPDSVTGLVPLWSALEKGDYGTAEVLVNHGCDVEGWAVVHDAMTNEHGDLEDTLLHRAIATGNSRSAIFLIRSGCNVNAVRRIRRDQYDSPQRGRKSVMERGDNSTLTKDTPLHMSISSGSLEVSKALISHLNCKIASQRSDLKTAAHIAVEKQDLAILDLLLSHPDTSAFTLRDSGGRTPLALAIHKRYDKLAETIYRRLPDAAALVNERGENILHEAVRENDLESVLFLLGLQIDVNIPVRDKEKKTALHLCAESGTDLILRNLILAGVEVNRVNVRGQTPLHTAATGGKTEMCRILLENGADVNAVDSGGNNALHIAVMSGAPETVQFLLLESAVNYIAVNKERQNILHLCASNTGISSVEVFLTIMEIHPNYPLENTDMYGNTVFLLAFLNGHVDLCRLTLKTGCCMGVLNHQGQSAFNIETPTKQLLFGLLDGLDREPQWSEGDECSECTSKFTLTMRKHHCRHCGRLVCAKCSDHQMPILKYNNNKTVRVCQICLDVLTGGAALTSNSTLP